MRLMLGSLLASLAIAFAAPACAVDTTATDEGNERSQSSALTTGEDGAAANMVCRHEPGGIGGDNFAAYSACISACGAGASACKSQCCQQVTGCRTCVIL